MSGKLLVDASVYITLAELELTGLLYEMGSVSIPNAVYNEIQDEPASTKLEEEIDAYLPQRPNIFHWLSEEEGNREPLETAARHLGYSLLENTYVVKHFDEGEYRELKTGDLALLAGALAIENAVVITDDKPLRKACKALSIPVSGSIGVLVRAVERGDLEADVAKDKLYAMDEVGARLSASLIRRAERLIKEADES